MARKIHKNELNIVLHLIDQVYRLLTIFYEPPTIVNDSLTIAFICKTIIYGCKL